MSGVLYLEICALCVPIYFILLFFSDYYSYYVENYGRLLLIRNCKKSKMILEIYRRIAIWLGLFIVLQLGINVAWFYCTDITIIIWFLRTILLYYLIMFMIIIFGFFLCTFLKDNAAHLALNVYIWISFFAHCVFESDILKKVFIPGKMLFAKRDICNKSDFFEEYVQCIGAMIVIYIATVYRCRKKDIY